MTTAKVASMKTTIKASIREDSLQFIVAVFKLEKL